MQQHLARYHIFSITIHDDERTTSLLSSVERRLLNAIVHDKCQEVGDVEDDADRDDDQADAPGHLARAVCLGTLAVPADVGGMGVGVSGVRLAHF